VGFLKFIKKKSTKPSSNFDDLDLPPAPPHMGSHEEHHSEAPHKLLTSGEDLKLPEMPKFAAHHEEPEHHDLPVSHHEEPSHHEEHHEEHHPAKVHHPKPAAGGVMHSGNRLYIRVELFKHAVTTIGDLKGKIKTSEVYFRDFNELKSSEEEALSSFKTSVSELQKKLTFIDRKLFKDGG
tara:strand:- start:34043 stop:34582 length:540 start_codon:yes stop_codon:yes gene_type:complete